MKKNTTISRLIKFSLLLLLVTASKLSFSQACDPKWNRVKSSNCENSPIQFEANSPGKTDFEWDYGDGTGSGTGQGPAYRNPTHAYGKAGTYTVVFKASGGASSCTDTVMITIKESPIIDVTALYNSSQCFAGNKFCFVDKTKAATNSKILTLRYLFSDGGLYVVNDPKGGDTICHSVIDPNGGDFDLTIEAEDYNGCITKVIRKKFIKVFPKLGVKFISSAPNACIQSVATITNQTDTFTKLKDIASFVWNFGNPNDADNIITGDSVTNTGWWRGPTGNGVLKHTYSVAGKPSGTYVFNGSLTVTTRFGCTEKYIFKGSATISILNVKIIADPDSSCSSESKTEFTAVDIETLQPLGQVNSFLWNFGDPPSNLLNFDRTTLFKAPHDYGLGPWMISLNIKAGPCNVTIFDTITKVGVTSAIETIGTRIPIEEKYQCVITDSVHMTNVSSFYHADDVPVFEDSSGVYSYYFVYSRRPVYYYQLPLTSDSINGNAKGVKFYKSINTTITRFYLEKDTLETFTQSVLAKDSIIYYVNGKKIKKPIVNPIISGNDTFVIKKQKEYAFLWPGNQTRINSTAIPPGPQKHKEHVLRLWDFGDNYAPKCTTDTRRNRNVGLNCNFSMDSLPVHWYTPWDQIYKYYGNAQFYGAPATKMVLCKGGRYCYQVRYYPQMSFVIPSDTLVIVPKDSTFKYAGRTITPATPENFTGTFRIKKVPSKISGFGIYTPTLSDETWFLKTPSSIRVKNITSGAYYTKGPGNATMKLNDPFELRPEVVWRTYNSNSTGFVVYDELKEVHFEPSHNYSLVLTKRDSISPTGTYKRDLDKVTRFYLEKDTLETFNQKFADPDSIIYYVAGKKVKKAITNPIVSGNDKLTLTEFRILGDTAYSISQIVITAGRTVNAQPTTICVDTIIGGKDTFVTRNRIFIDSAFHRSDFYFKSAQCNQVKLYHEDTIHALRCKSLDQKSLALLPPNAKGLEFEGIRCYAPPSPPYGMRFDVGKTKPGCTQRLLKFNFDSASGKNNWVSHSGFLAPPLPGIAPWWINYPLSGAYGTRFVQAYGAGQIQNRNPGWVTVGVVIGNGKIINGGPPVLQCMDTVWYHNAFRYLYLDSRFIVIAPEKDKKTVCVGDTITFRLIDPIMDSITQLVWNWNDDQGSYYEERSSYYKPYKGPNANRNDKVIKDWKPTDKWLYNYVVRLEYDGFNFKTLDTIVTGVIRKWSIGVDVSRAGDALKRAFEALGLNMNEIPAADIPYYFGNGTGKGCIDTTGLGSLISFAVAPYRDALTFSRHSPEDVIMKDKNGKDSIYSEDWYKYTDYTKKDSIIISQSIHWRSKSQAGWDTLQQANPNRYSGLKATPGVYRHVYKKANRYFPTFQLRNTEGCFGPRNKEVDVGFYWNWSFTNNSDSIVCHGEFDITIKDSIRYFAYEDPFVWLNPKDYWKDPKRFLALKEGKKLDFNEHDDSIPANIFNVRGLGIPPFSWHYDDPGIYTIRVAMFDSLGCVDTFRQKVYVTGVKAGFNSNAGILSCKNIVSFFDTSKMIDPCVALKGIKCDEIVDWTWDFGDGKQKSKLRSPSHDFTQNGTFTVRLKVITKLGCVDSASIMITVYGPQPYFNPISDTLICVGDSVIFDNLSLPVIGPNAQWEWNFGDGKVTSTIVKQPVGHRYTSPGTYKVYLTMFDEIPGTSIRCAALYPDTSSDLVTKIERIVRVKPVAPADFDIAPNDTICPNTLVTFTSQSDTLYKRFIWRFGDGDTVSTNQTSASHNYPKKGIFQVTLIPDYDTPEFNKCLDTVKKNIVVLDVTADFEIIDKDAPKFCFPNKSTGATKYQWKFQDPLQGDGASTEFSPCYTWKDTGCFKVTLIVTNDIGCTDQKDSIVCYKLVTKIIPYNVFTPEPKDGINDVFRANAEGLDEFDIKIYNRWGVLVFESTDQFFQWNGKIKNTGADCPDGTYMYIMNFKLKNKGLNSLTAKDQKTPVSGMVTLIRGK